MWITMAGTKDLKMLTPLTLFVTNHLPSRAFLMIISRVIGPSDGRFPNFLTKILRMYLHPQKAEYNFLLLLYMTLIITFYTFSAGHWIQLSIPAYRTLSTTFYSCSTGHWVQHSTPAPQDTEYNFLLLLHSTLSTTSYSFYTWHWVQLSTPSPQDTKYNFLLLLHRTLSTTFYSFSTGHWVQFLLLLHRTLSTTSYSFSTGHWVQLPTPIPQDTEYNFLLLLHRNTLQQHMKVHTGKDFKCQNEGCIFACRSHAELRNHQQVHSDHRPYQCDTCSYSAKTKPQLLRWRTLSLVSVYMEGRYLWFI
jgi:hypothetical protein